MTKKELIKSVISGKAPPYTPHHFDLTMRVTDMLGNYYGFDRDGIEDFIGNHFLYVDFTAPEGKDSGYHGNSGSNTIVVDEFGVSWDIARIYDIGDWGMVGSPVSDMDLSGYEFPRGDGKGRFGLAQTLIRKYPDRFCVLRMTGLFDSCWHICGMEDFMIAMAGDEEFACTILDRVTDYMIGIIEQIPPGIDAVRFIEDWGMQTGLLFSKQHWMTYLRPRLAQIHAACRKKGVRVMHHTCGDVTELMDEIVKLGVDILDAIQPEAMDIRFIKKTYGKDIVLFGGLGAQSTLPKGTPQDVVREAEETLAILGENGRYIIGPAGSISTETPLENVVALTEFCMALEKRGM